jgi:hypothetical protein
LQRKKIWTLSELLTHAENRRGQLDEREAKNSQSEAGAATQQYQVSSQLKFSQNLVENFAKINNRSLFIKFLTKKGMLYINM